jgi:hypothetical protein
LQPEPILSAISLEIVYSLKELKICQTKTARVKMA